MDREGTKLYFAYGSNLWRAQMESRCPNSTYVALGRLPDYRWFICERGYANVIPSAGDEVWGMLYTLTPSDEARLDINEGVPYDYEKQMLTIGVPHSDPVEALVYVDVHRLVDGPVKHEYIYRMTMAIKDAVAHGMPKDYIEKYMLKPLTLGPEVLDGDA